MALWAVGLGLAIVKARAVAAAGVAPALPNLLSLPPSAVAAAAWLLTLAGVGLRVWAAGNLEKNRFTRPTGPYRLVRHPLYLGTLLISLGFFASLGAPVAGGLLWLALLGGVFLPVLRKEERELDARFPRYAAYLRGVPALLPGAASVGAALASDRFTWDRARRNYGLRALLFLALVPVLNAILVRAAG